MRFDFLPKYLIVNFLLFLNFIILSGVLLSLESFDSLVPSIKNPYLYELNNITFVGNPVFPENELLKLLTNKPTSRSLPHRTLQHILNLFNQNKAAQGFKTTRFIAGMLDQVIDGMSSEIKYMDKSLCEVDSVRLFNYFYQKGFHNVKVAWRVYPELQKKQNTLEFNIEAGVRWNLGKMIYIGLDSLPPDVIEKIEDLKFLTVGEPFDEFALSGEINLIAGTLLQNGYYYSKYELKPIVIDYDTHVDSVSIIFNTGIRQRIGAINIIDSSRDEKIVSHNMKMAQLEIFKGDWFNPVNISRSEINLYSLGTFDFVKIDTSSIFKPMNDSTLNLVVNLQYRKQQDWSVSLLANQTSIDKAFNAGVELQYSHKNIFGAAQVFNPFIRVVATDLSNRLQRQIEWEWQVGINLTQPLLWIINKARIAGSVQFLYTQKNFNQYLKIETWSTAFKFPIKLFQKTWFQNMSLDFTFERQMPLNFETSWKRVLDSAKTDLERNLAAQTIALYQNLDKYVHDPVAKPLLTSNTISFSITRDTRDNPFSPTKGSFAFLSADWGRNIFPIIDMGLNFLFKRKNILSGNADYIRLQATFSFFWAFMEKSVFALKARAGHIAWSNKTTTYVPFERQFFAGGSNSNRGWQSRQLRFDQFPDSLKGTSSYNFATDYIGNTTIIEGSIEFRQKFGRPELFGETVADQIALMGATAFIDFGNAFQWMIIENNEYKYSPQIKFSDLITGIAVGGGIGLRYDTPVGPIRVDFAWQLYNPALKEKKWIFENPTQWNNIQFHFGLGHAF